jgi:hypothetical protein
MSASRVPIVTEDNGRFSVCLAPGSRLTWLFVKHGDKEHCVVCLDVPDVVKEWTIVDRLRDLIRFPVVRQ